MKILQAWDIKISSGCYAGRFTIVGLTIEKAIVEAVRLADKECSGKITATNVQIVDNAGAVYVY